jgi:prepilin-type N-terminal cleavage/methylation domain-containing protein
MRSSSPPRIAARRGFTLVEVMLVVLIIGIVTSLAIPGFQKATARARRTEAMVALSKMQMYFVNLFENQGNFCPPDVTCAGSYTSVLNLRYQFIANGTTLTLKAYGSFPGQASLGVIPGTSFDHSYEYTVTFQGTTLDSKNIVETPAF